MIKITRPDIATKICRRIPVIIRTILIMAPKRREKILDTRVLKNSTKSNPLGYLQLYLRQGAKNVFRSWGTEK